MVKGKGQSQRSMKEKKGPEINPKQEWLSDYSQKCKVKSNSVKTVEHPYSKEVTLAPHFTTYSFKIDLTVKQENQSTL